VLADGQLTKWLPLNRLNWLPFKPALTIIIALVAGNLAVVLGLSTIFAVWYFRKWIP
jgi:hypothetical protein